MVRHALVATMVCVLAGPTAAQDDPFDRTYWLRGEDLVAALDAQDPRADAFVAGTLSGYLVRSRQGDAMLWWVHRCVARTFLNQDDLLEGIRAEVASVPEDAGEDVRFAAQAILYALADYCSVELDRSQ
ncbi:MAG: hypothetical protein H6843_12610 [Rhodospirillaceae bacterium]|nr:hypothetical protein [Rhodospirillaceae bacterium]